VRARRLCLGPVLATMAALACQAAAAAQVGELDAQPAIAATSTPGDSLLQTLQTEQATIEDGLSRADRSAQMLDSHFDSRGPEFSRNAALRNAADHPLRLGEQETVDKMLREIEAGVRAREEAGERRPPPQRPAEGVSGALMALNDSLFTKMPRELREWVKANRDPVVVGACAVLLLVLVGSSLLDRRRRSDGSSRRMGLLEGWKSPQGRRRRRRGGSRASGQEASSTSAGPLSEPHCAGSPAVAQSSPSSLEPPRSRRRSSSGSSRSHGHDRRRSG